MADGLAKLRPLTTTDIPAAMALVDQVGWNQTPADWARFLAASPTGCFAAIIDGVVVGTSATIAYEGRLAWVGMVIVDAAHRGKGLGRQLLERACDAMDAANIPCVKLDATPAGEPLYAKYGFVRERSLERWELSREPSKAPRLQASTAPLSGEAFALDRSLFGADRRFLLDSLKTDWPEAAIEVRAGREVLGYSLGRRGYRADHMGPWIARDEHTAAQLLDAFLARSKRPRVFVDCFVDHQFAVALLEARGFQPQRPLVRMSRGPSPPADNRDVLAPLGVEFG